MRTDQYATCDGGDDVLGDTVFHTYISTYKEEIRPMPWPPSLTSLQEVLAALYPTIDDSMPIIVEAGLNPAQIQLEKKALNNWYQILREAHHQATDENGESYVQKIVRIAWEAHKGHPGLAAAMRGEAAAPASRPVDQGRTAASRVASEGDGRVRVLFLASNPIMTSALQLGKEVREIQGKIRSSRYRDSLEFVTRWAVHPDDLQQALLEVDPHIVHFSGHGSSKEGLFFESDAGFPVPVDEDTLADLLSILQGNIRLVMLNACQTRPLAKAITTHIDFAIGMRTDIPDEAAIEFASAFYQAIGYGRSIKIAFDLGRNALRLKKIPEDQNAEILARPGVNAAEVVLVRS
jgi:hypothetical protein